MTSTELGSRTPVGAPEGARSFVTTHWSVVRAAGDRSSPESHTALAALCKTYWYPLYTFIRRQGHGPHDAEDLTQSFFCWLLESGQLGVADPDCGRFRSFILTLLKHFLSDERKKALAQKRGGGKTILSLDAQSAEERYLLEPTTPATAERAFDQRWALAILEQTVGHLREEYVASGRAELFEELRHFQSIEEASGSYRDAARRLGVSESAVKSAIFRLRRRYTELLREVVAQTVATPAEIDQEIRHLLAAMVD